jgi:hypothetical protein
MANQFRIIMDELLLGNTLEEIVCRDVVDTDALDRVPIGATPDDIARCSTAQDVLPKSCPGSNPHSVCICKNDGGCGATPKGSPVGVKDVNQDGAADDSSFIADAVQLKCGTHMVPTDVNTSYWYPSGDQNVPASGGFDALGPAVVLQAGAPPGTTLSTGFLPTNTECTLVFNPDVVDKQGHKVCAPPGGDVAQPCTEGDLSAVKFKVEPLGVISSVAGTMVGKTSPVVLVATSAIDPATTPATLASGITMTPAPPAGTMLMYQTPTTLRIVPPAAGFTGGTMYTISIATTVADFYGEKLPQPITITFTTLP